MEKRRGDGKNIRCPGNDFAVPNYGEAPLPSPAVHSKDQTIVFTVYFLWVSFPLCLQALLFPSSSLEKPGEMGRRRTLEQAGGIDKILYRQCNPERVPEATKEQEARPLRRGKRRISP